MQLTYFAQYSEKKHKLDDEIIIRLVDDQLQMTEKGTWVIYQIYFYINLFKPLETRKTINNKKIN